MVFTELVGIPGGLDNYIQEATAALEGWRHYNLTGAMPSDYLAPDDGCSSQSMIGVEQSQPSRASQDVKGPSRAPPSSSDSESDSSSDSGDTGSSEEE